MQLSSWSWASCSRQPQLKRALVGIASSLLTAGGREELWRSTWGTERGEKRGVWREMSRVPGEREHKHGRAHCVGCSPQLARLSSQLRRDVNLNSLPLWRGGGRDARWCGSTLLSASRHAQFELIKWESQTVDCSYSLVVKLCGDA